MECDHLERRWEEKSYVDWNLGEVDCSEWVTYPSFEDIDTHRMKCTKCGKIAYYSGVARAFYEDGVKHPYIQGLQ